MGNRVGRTGGARFIHGKSEGSTTPGTAQNDAATTASDRVDAECCEGGSATLRQRGAEDLARRSDRAVRHAMTQANLRRATREGELLEDAARRGRARGRRFVQVDEAA